MTHLHRSTDFGRPHEATLAVDVAGLRKSYGTNLVLDGVDLQVPAGSVYALLGINGAGKTTIVRILATLTAMDGGTARVAGHDVVADPKGVRASIGVTGQFSSVDDFLTPRENLALISDLFHQPRLDARARAEVLLDQFGLAEAAGKTASTLSGGMKRKLDLAMTLVSLPRVIFLDEPTTGLDPHSRRLMWDLIRTLVESSGVTVLLTTQYLEEADQLADTVGILHGGRIVASGSPAELKGQDPGGRLDDVFIALTGHATTTEASA